MKHTLHLFFLLLLFSSILHAQEPTFAWAKRMGGISSDAANSVVVDAVGNVYTMGLFQGTADFDPGPGIFNLTSAGNYDIFISKLDASGNFVWAKSMGSVNYDLGLSIAIDGSGNVYTTGGFQGTADFDPGAGIFNLTSVGNYDIFVSKLDASGNFVWAKSMGSSGFDAANSLAVDATGNIYTTGSFEATADFDPGPGTFNLTSIGQFRDIFISKLDPSGNFVWAKRMGGTSNEEGASIVIDGSGNVYTTGNFQGTADFDPGPGTFNLTTKAGTFDMFISKLDAAGNFLWANSMGGTGTDAGKSIALDGNGNLYTTGYFEGTADFDPGPGIFNLTSAGNLDIFISKLDPSGNFVWAKRVGGTSDDYGTSLAVDAGNNVHATGSFNGIVDFDPGDVTFNLASAGDLDAFVLKLTQSPTCTPPTFLNDASIVLDASKCGNDGNISIIPKSGTAPFMYSINGGATYVAGPDAGYTFQNLAAGTYQLRLKDANGCQSAVVTREVKTVYECPACTPPTFLNNSSIVLDASCKGGDGNISIIPTSGTGPFMYSIDSGATYVAGPDGGYTFQNLAAGTYQLRLKAGNGCESAVVTKVVNANAYGNCATVNAMNPRLRSSAIDAAASVRAYPNPSHGQFQLQLNGFASFKVQVQILDIRGSVLQTKVVNASENTSVNINLQGKAKGLYLVRVISDKGVQMQKVTVQ